MRFEGKRAGFIVTNIFTNAVGVPDEQRDQVRAMIAAGAEKAQPVKRAGRPEDIAAAVAFLLSEDAAFITGTHLLVDGGMLVGTRPSWDPDAPNMMSALDAFR